MRKYILLLCAVCMSFVSCVKDNMAGLEADGLTRFKAVHADKPTKTVLEGLTPMWTPADKISVYDGVNNQFSNSLSAPAKTAVFKGKLGGIEKTYLAASPYNVDLMFILENKGIYGLMIPYEQQAVEGTYDPTAMVSVAYTADSNLKFKNVCSLIKFKVVSEGVTSVKVVANGGESLSGQFNVVYSDEPKTTPSQGRKPEVVLKGEFMKDSTYYISTMVASLGSGLTVILNDSVTSMEYASPVALERSGLVDLGTLSLNPEESDLPSAPGAAEHGYVYLKPNTNWLEAGARFAAYFFEDGKPEAWVDLSPDTETGVYKCKVPSGYTNVIFVRMNPAVSENRWNTDTDTEATKPVWNQTTDLTVPLEDEVCYVLKPDVWDGEGSWSAYPPENVDPAPGDDVETSGTIYMRPNSNWLEAGARFAAYFFEGANNVWVSMVADVEANVFKCDVPSGFSNVIFVRMNPAVSENRWNTDTDTDTTKPVWNQTADLFVPGAGSTSICYVVTPGTWGEEGYWTTYPPVVTDPEPENPAPDTPVTPELTSCRLVVKVTTSIDWYDKYIYCWENDQPLLGAWPGTKLDWDKQDGDYYVYYHDFDKSMNGKTLNYIVNKGEGGNGNQTNDLSVVLNGAETTVTIETSDLK